jgi:aspartyl-tRNA(Asn)/glutamyl-tRNA(Gln) amidotransferase subunit A
MRLGRARAWFEDRVHPAVAAAYEAALAELAGMGMEIVDVALPDIDVVETAAWTVIYAEMLSMHKDHAHLIEERDSMGAGMLAAGPYVYAADYLTALRYRSTFQGQLDAAMAGVDALVLPGSTTPPPKLVDMLADTGAGEVDWLDVACRPHVSFNYSGSPGLCLPSGFADGLPSSVQLVGRPHADATLLTIGAAYQRVTDHHRAAPSLAGSATAEPSTMDDALIERSPA